jgi:serine protease Do
MQSVRWFEDKKIAGNSLRNRKDCLHRLLVPLLLPVLMATAQAARAAECEKSFPDIYKAASSAVVTVTTRSINPYRVTNRVQRGIGSGFIVAPNGLILTNSHVVYGAQALTVTLDNGTVRRARIVGQDPIFDIAVIQIPTEPDEHLPLVEFGNSDAIQVGEEIAAIGNPLGLEQTLTRGVISALNRVLPEKPLSLSRTMIQTDAAINPGNSGGPLLDRCGKVIGMSTEIIAGAHGIAFAIPSNLIRAAIGLLLEHGHIVRPWLGFHGQLVDKEINPILNSPMVAGLLVEVIEPQSPAEKAGLRGGEHEIAIDGNELLWGGDIVTKINGTRIDSMERLGGAMDALRVGQRVALEVFRSGRTERIEYELPERPTLPGDVPEGALLLQPSPASGASRRY